MAVAAGMVLFTACEQNGGGNMPSNATASDSLMYYLGQFDAARFKMEADNDTSLNSPQARQSFLAGVQAGLNQLRQDDEAYNRGFTAGLQTASNVTVFNERYDVNLNKNLYLSALRSELMSDSTEDARSIQLKFQMVMTNIMNEKEEKDKKAASETLAQAIAGKDYKKVTDDLYGKIENHTDSAKIKDGELVKLDLTVNKLDGQSVYSPVPPQTRVGAQNLPKVITDALMIMKSGETGSFMTTGIALFGQRAEQNGIQPSEVLSLTLKASTVEEANKPADAPKVKMN